MQVPLQSIVFAVLGAVDLPLVPCMLVHLWQLALNDGIDIDIILILFMHMYMHISEYVALYQCLAFCLPFS